MNHDCNDHLEFSPREYIEGDGENNNTFTESGYECRICGRWLCSEDVNDIPAIDGIMRKLFPGEDEEDSFEKVVNDAVAEIEKLGGPVTPVEVLILTRGRGLLKLNE